MEEHPDLKALGSSKTTYKFDGPDKALLETFPSPFSKVLSPKIEIVAPEFTSLCPKTGQPDFATIKISYVPTTLCVESKSLKLYLMSYRMHGAFHESCVNQIAAELLELLDPRKLWVKGEFTPRGGIPFWPEVFYERPLPWG